MSGANQEIPRPHEIAMAVHPEWLYFRGFCGDRKEDRMAPRLEGKVALVAGATRGAGRGIALELGAAGATVYCTGRSTKDQRSEMDRPETIEETAELIEREGGRAVPVQVDHLDQ